MTEGEVLRELHNLGSAARNIAAKCSEGMTEMGTMKTMNYTGAAMMVLAAVLAFVGVTPVIVGLVCLTAAGIVLTGTYARADK
jgi:hypothetical protein